MRVGLLGAGRIGALHARILAGNPDVEVLAIGDVDAGRREALAGELGGEHGTIEEVLDSGPDAVVIAASTSAHADLIRAAVDADIPGFCEKPIALGSEETLEIVEEVESSGAVFQIGFQRRFDAGYVEAKRLIDDGSLGTLYSVRLATHDPEPPHEGYIPVSGGIFRDLHIHDFDILRWLTGSEVEEVYATGSVRKFDVFAKYRDVDTSAALMRLAGGVVAGAPISWGVCEVPGWGYQMDAERVLREAAELGLGAVEAGPEGFLPPDPAEASRLLSLHRLRLVGGFVPAVLYRPEVREEQLESVEKQVGLFAAAGAEVVVLAASTGQDGYEESAELDEGEWEELFQALALVEEIGARHGLSVVLHPHYGTVIESPEDVRRFLEGCEMGLCLDTGHLMVGGGDPDRVAESAPMRVRRVHLKDVDAGLAEVVASGAVGYEEAVRRGLYRPLGEGDVDLKRVIELLEEVGYEGWYVLEQDVMLDAEPGADGGPYEDVRKSLEFLSRIGS